jgi:hypothetical protein
MTSLMMYGIRVFHGALGFSMISLYYIKKIKKIKKIKRLYNSGPLLLILKVFLLLNQN